MVSSFDFNKGYITIYDEEGNTIEGIHIRREIADFCVAMEKEMLKKDKLGYNNHSRSINHLKEKLKEERNEVDECFVQSSTFYNKDSNMWVKKFINEESLHEGIILLLIRDRMLDGIKKC